MEKGWGVLSKETLVSVIDILVYEDLKMNKKDIFTMDYFNLIDEIKCEGNPKLLSEK